MASTLVFETRGPEPPEWHGMPTSAAQRSWVALVELFKDIRSDERARGVELTREPDPGFAEPAYLWASGLDLEEVLAEEDAPGDFVRSTKQLIDLLRQLLDVNPPADLRARLREAVNRLQRGVVAYSSLDV